MNQSGHADEEGSYEGEDASSSGPTTKKSERKRQREKDRRKEMAEGFVELGQLLAQIDPDDSDNQNRRRKRRGSEDGSADPDSSGMTRIDLISRAIDTMRKLHAENQELKRSKTTNSGDGGEDKEVLVMVPTLQPSGSGGLSSTGGPPSEASASYQPYYAHQTTTLGERRVGPPHQHSPPSYYPPLPPAGVQAGATQDHPPTASMPHLTYGFPPHWGVPASHQLHPSQHQQHYGEPLPPHYYAHVPPPHMQGGAIYPPPSSPYPSQQTPSVPPPGAPRPPSNSPHRSGDSRS